MKPIKQLSDLNRSELEKIRTTLNKRFDIGKRGNVIEIAFGVAEKDGKLDLTRRNAICFYVTSKRNPRAKSDRIPKCIEIRICRRRKYFLVCMATDVIELGTKKIQPTGKRVRDLRRTDFATTGCVIAWRTSGHQTRLTWGLLSVGHYFNHVALVPETTQQVRINSSTTPLHRFRGTLIARTQARDSNESDAALIRVARSSLVRAQLIDSNQSTVGKTVRRVVDLQQDRGRAGFTFPIRTRLSFVVARYLPLSNIVPVLGPIRDVIEATSGTSNAFGGGRSGSVWVIGRQVACTQHAGLANSYTRGWGQSVATIFEWAISEIAQINNVLPIDVELKVIKIV